MLAAQPLLPLPEPEKWNLKPSFEADMKQMEKSYDPLLKSPTHQAKNDNGKVKHQTPPIITTTFSVCFELC